MICTELPADEGTGTGVVVLTGVAVFFAVGLGVTLGIGSSVGVGAGVAVGCGVHPRDRAVVDAAANGHACTIAGMVK